MTDEEKVKYRLSDIGEKVGELALNYIENLEKENKQLKIDMEIADSQRQLAEKENKELIDELNLQNQRLNELKNENAELKGEVKAVREILEELKESYNAVIDEVIDTARGYGLVSDSALFSYINEYDNKAINYDELLDRIRNETIIELKLAIEDMKK